MRDRRRTYGLQFVAGHHIGYSNREGTAIMTSSQAMYDTLIANPATSYALRGWLNAAQSRDPVDVMHDAECLLQYARLRVAEALESVSASDLGRGSTRQ